MISAASSTPVDLTADIVASVGTEPPQIHKGGRTHNFAAAIFALTKKVPVDVGGETGVASGESGVVSEEWRVVSGELRVVSGESGVVSEELRVVSGEWRVVSEELRVVSGELRVVSEDAQAKIATNAMEKGTVEGRVSKVEGKSSELNIPLANSSGSAFSVVEGSGEWRGISEDAHAMEKGTVEGRGTKVERKSAHKSESNIENPPVAWSGEWRGISEDAHAMEKGTVEGRVSKVERKSSELNIPLANPSASVVEGSGEWRGISEDAHAMEKGTVEGRVSKVERKSSELNIPLANPSASVVEGSGEWRVESGDARAGSEEWGGISEDAQAKIATNAMAKRTVEGRGTKVERKSAHKSESNIENPPVAWSGEWRGISEDAHAMAKGTVEGRVSKVERKSSELNIPLANPSASVVEGSGEWRGISEDAHAMVKRTVEGRVSKVEGKSSELNIPLVNSSGSAFSVVEGSGESRVESGDDRAGSEEWRVVSEDAHAKIAMENGTVEGRETKDDRKPNELDIPLANSSDSASSAFSVVKESVESRVTSEEWRATGASDRSQPIPASLPFRVENRQLAPSSEPAGTAVAKQDMPMNIALEEQEIAAEERQKVPAAPEKGKKMSFDIHSQVSGPLLTADLHPQFDAGLARESLVVQHAGRTEPLVEVVREQVTILKQADSGSTSVLIRPDAHTEILLQLHRTGNETAVYIRLDRGDAGHFQEQWKNLESALAQQNIKLSRDPISSNSAPLNQGSQQQGGFSRSSDREPRPSPVRFETTDAGQDRQESRGRRHQKQSQYRGWESWA